MKSINVFAILVASIVMLSCQKEEISTTGIIKDHFYLQNNDANMQVYVEGNISSDKILIMVHGGPGDGSLYFNTKEATRIAEPDMAIAYWDQRLAGSSQSNHSATDIESYADDLKKLITLLHYRYGASKKIYLLAHSWGGLIAPYFLGRENNQSLIAGWIQVDGVHNYALTDSLSRQELIKVGLEEIAANKHVEDWTEIVDYCKTHDPTGNYKVARKINVYANGTDDLISEVYKGTSQKELINYFIREYQYPITTFPTNKIYNVLLEKIEKQAYELNVSGSLQKITIPTLLLWGKYDYVAPFGLKDDILQHINSADKSSKIFEHSGHTPMFQQSELFWQTVKDWMVLH